MESIFSRSKKLPKNVFILFHCIRRMEYRTEFITSIETHWRQHKITPKHYKVHFTPSLIFAHLEYELYYLMNDTDSEYMMDWIDLKFEGNVPVPPPPGKQLSVMEKRFRLHFLYNALTPHRATKKTGSVSSFLLFIAVGVILWYAWNYIKTRFQCLPTISSETPADTTLDTNNGIMPPTWNMGNTWYYIGLVAIIFLL